MCFRIYGYLKLVVTCIFLFFITTGLIARQVPHGKPKIGLVLSGGGAKGMAHIGVLKAMEEAGIRPDIIVGTSMGAVIGGLYAIGYNAAELEEILMDADWDLIVSNRVAFNNIAFEEKEYYNRYLLELPIHNKKIAFPSGLIEGQKLSEMLHHYTWPANQFESFDDFPIPFRCVATDVGTGNAVIIDKGYLTNALRSSIAIPTAFTPYELDGRMVVDGGVVNNFPVDIAKEMGAEIVIGVNVGDEDFQDPKLIGSFSGILMQIAMSQSYTKLQENIGNCDIYIKPDLKGNSTASFGRYKEIMQLGEEAGALHLQDFRELADRYGFKSRSRGIGLEVPPIVVDRIEINGNRIFSTSLILSKLAINEGDLVDREDIHEGISRVYGINGFKKVDFTLVHLRDNTYTLKIRTVEKSDVLFFSSVYYDNMFSAGLLFNLTARDFVGRSSRTVLIGDVSENPKFRLDHYKYMGDEKKYAFNLRYNYMFQQVPNFSDGRSVDVYINRESQLSAQIISTQSLKQSFSLGAFYQKNKSRSKFNIALPGEVRNASNEFLGLRGLYNRNSLNDRNFPTRGSETILEGVLKTFNKLKINLRDGVDTLYLQANGNRVGIPAEDLNAAISVMNPNPYLSFYFNYVKYFSIGEHTQLIPTLSTAMTFSADGMDKQFDEFYLGGHQRIRFNDTRSWGINYGEILTPNFGKIGLTAQYLPAKNIYVRMGSNLIGLSPHIPLVSTNHLEIIDIYRKGMFLGYGLDASINTHFGPISAGIGSNTKDFHVRGYFSIGFSFNYSDR